MLRSSKISKEKWDDLYNSMNQKELMGFHQMYGKLKGVLSCIMDDLIKETEALVRVERIILDQAQVLEQTEAVKKELAEKFFNNEVEND